MNSTSEGMRLAQNQPPAPGFSLRHNIIDPQRSKLGIVKMLVGTNHVLHDRRTGVRSSLVVRDIDEHRDVTDAVVVCLHPLCAGKAWKAQKAEKGVEAKTAMEACVAEHPTAKELAAAGETHVVGWYSESVLGGEATKDGPDFGALIKKAEASVQLREKELLEGKDEKSTAEGLERYELAKKNLAGLKRLSIERQTQIVGFLSDEQPGR
jgi:hypothetical protein